MDKAWRLQSTGSQQVGYDLVTKQQQLLALGVAAQDTDKICNERPRAHNLAVETQLDSSVRRASEGNPDPEEAALFLVCLRVPKGPATFSGPALLPA